MHCPSCRSEDSKVLETRSQSAFDIRRRRKCLKCNHRFTTIESILVKYPYVVKKSGAREPFSPQKLRKGVQLACLKRPVSLLDIEQIIRKISDWVLNSNKKEIQTLELGQKVMEELKSIDDVAYVRFASVYKTFTDVQEFLKGLERDEEIVADKQ